MSDPTGWPVDHEEPTPARRALTFLVFAPVGMALTLVEDLPSLIVKGRRRVETDLRNARVIGQLVVDQGQRQLVHRVGNLQHGDAHRHPRQRDATTAA